MEEGIKLAGRVIKENMEERINKDNIEVSYISNTDRKIVNLSRADIEQLLTQI